MIGIKRLLLLMAMILIGMVSNAQLEEMESSTAKWITVGEVKWLSNTKASLKYFVAKNDTTYLLYMQDEQKLKNNRDMTMRKYFSISYSGVNNTNDKLFELLASFFSSESRQNKKLEKIFTLGNKLVHVQHYPKLTAAAILFSTKENHIVFTEKELNKLFGR